jgi:hypothetical protein
LSEILHVRFGSKADVMLLNFDVRFTPESCRGCCVGDLRWSDAALGWVATWSLKASGRRYRWSVRGVNYDEVFRNAVRGAARVLSGNDKPL